MSAPIPPRFSLSPISFSKALVVFFTGLVPAVTILLSPLPLWLRVWLWVPILGASVAATFGRLEGRNVVDFLLSLWRFVRRKRKRVWSTRSHLGNGKVVAEVPRRLPAWIVRAARGAQRRVEAAVTYGIVFGIALGAVFVLAVVIRWMAVQVFAPSDVNRPAYASGTEQPISAHYASSTPTPVSFPSPTSTLPSTSVSTPVPTLAPTPTPVAWGQGREWNVLALPGYLILGNPGPGACEVRLSAAGWEYAIDVPASEEGKVLVVPLLQPEMVDGRLVVRSSCDLDVDLVPYRPWRPQRSRLWLVPVCEPPGRVKIKPHGRQVSVTLLDLAGETVAGPVNVPVTGGWVPQAPEGCWLYRVDSVESVWLEVVVFAW